MASSCRVGWDETELDGLLLNVCDGRGGKGEGRGLCTGRYFDSWYLPASAIVTVYKYIYIYIYMYMYSGVFVQMCEIHL